MKLHLQICDWHHKNSHHADVNNVATLNVCSFLNLYGTEEGECISLDEAASRLGMTS